MRWAPNLPSKPRPLPTVSPVAPLCLLLSCTSIYNTRLLSAAKGVFWGKVKYVANPSETEPWKHNCSILTACVIIQIDDSRMKVSSWIGLNFYGVANELSPSPRKLRVEVFCTAWELGFENPSDISIPETSVAQEYCLQSPSSCSCRRWVPACPWALHILSAFQVCFLPISGCSSTLPARVPREGSGNLATDLSGCRSTLATLTAIYKAPYKLHFLCLPSMRDAKMKGFRGYADQLLNVTVWSKRSSEVGTDLSHHVLSPDLSMPT